MAAINQSDFTNWISDPVTKAYKIAVAESIGRVKEVLATSAGIDSVEDNFRRGYVTALQDCLEFRIDDLQETD